MKNSAFLLDVDGVLNSPENATTINPQLIQIMGTLEKDHFITLATGRNHEWVIKYIIKPLKTYVTDLSHVILSCEFGEVTVTFPNDTPVIDIETRYQVPKALTKDLIAITRDKFSQYVKLLDTHTFFAVEMADNISLETFKAHQKEMTQSYQYLIDKHKIPDMMIHEDFMGSNVRNNHTTKRNSAKKIIEFVKTKDPKVSHFIICGDSKADLETGRELHDQGLSFTLVFTGDPEIAKHADIPFTPIFPSKRYSEGTLEYLKGFKETK